MSTIVTGYASVEVCFKHQVPDGHCTAIVIDGAYTDTFHIRKESFGQVVSVIPGADRRFCENQVLLRSSLVDVEQFAAITSIVMVGCSCYILSGFGIVVYLVGITVLVAFVIIIVYKGDMCRPPT